MWNTLLILLKTNAAQDVINYVTITHFTAKKIVLPSEKIVKFTAKICNFTNRTIF